MFSQQFPDSRPIIIVSCLEIDRSGGRNGGNKWPQAVGIIEGAPVRVWNTSGSSNTAVIINHLQCARWPCTRNNIARQNAIPAVKTDANKRKNKFNNFNNTYNRSHTHQNGGIIDFSCRKYVYLWGGVNKLLHQWFNGRMWKCVGSQARRQRFEFRSYTMKVVN